MNKSTPSLFRLIGVQFKEYIREPSILFWTFGFPILIAWVLGIAFVNQGPFSRTVGFNENFKHQILKDFNLPDSVFQQQRPTLSYSDPSGIDIILTFKPLQPEAAITAIKRGQISVFIEFMNDSTTYRFDPKNQDAFQTYLVLETLLPDRDGADHSKVAALQATGTRYIDFLIPGLIVLGIMNSCMWGIGWSLVEIRMKKLLRRMVATPMKKSDFLLSQIITRFFLNGLEILVLILFAAVMFGVTIEGNMAALITLFAVGIFAFAGIAILTASRTENTRVANGLINVVTFPMLILSGVFFSYQQFPDWAVVIIQWLPLTLLADSVRAIFIEGAGWTESIKAIGVLSALGMVTFFTGLKLFRWY